MTKETKLYKGERLRKDGRYEFRITKNGVTKSISAKTLAELRQKKDELDYMKTYGVNIYKDNLTLNDVYDTWKKTKRGLKPNTFTNYCYMYEKFVYHDLGRKKIVQIENIDIVAFYNSLYDEKNLQANTIDTIHTVIHQLFKMAIKNNILRYNPSDEALKELRIEDKNKKREQGYTKINYLSIEEEKKLFGFIKNSTEYGRWYPLLKFIDSTGVRVGEVCALQDSDIDYNNRTISINKTLIVYTKKQARENRNESIYEIGTTKTEAGERVLYLTDELEELIKQEKQFYKDAGIKCKASVSNYDNFLFLNKDGLFYKGCTINKAIDRIVTACNADLVRKGDKDNLIPHTHVHMLRHTFNTRMMEAGVPIEDRMKTLGQTDPEVNLKIYTHVSDNAVKKAMEITKDYCYNHSVNTNQQLQAN